MNLRPARLLPHGNVILTPASEFLRPPTIRARLRRILLVAVVLVLALLAVIINGEIGRYRDTGSAAHAVDLALSVQDLVHELQRERGLTNGLLGGDGSVRPAVAAERLAVDTALRQLNSELGENAPGTDQVRAALDQLSGISAKRGDVDANRVDRSASFTFYTSAILALNQARPGLETAQDSRLWRGMQTLYALGDVKELTGQQRGFLNGVFAAGGFGTGEYVQFLDIRAGKQSAITAFERNATSEERSQLYAAMRTDESVRAAEAEAVAIGSMRGPLLEQVNPADWWREMTSVIDSERGVQRFVGDEIHTRAAELRRHAALELGLYVLAALTAICAMVAVVVTTARAIVRPLADLAAEADAVAEQRLPQLIAEWQDSSGGDPAPPEPVRADAAAGTEILSVAKALDRVQATAFELASAQARLRRNTTESLSNLARRNQNLVRRQLGLISDFEREELDPKALSNLFELDHLATRMRRNAESLLVLVGESSPRRWSQSIALTDVIRAGLSEVDDYRRVVLRRVDDAAIAGSAVSELAHMLAELIENGLSFSPPDLEVEIYGRRQGGRYLIAIVDHGVGMPPDQLAVANARLRGEADFLVAPTRYLGHFVVGRLAKRLGIEVELTVSPVSGVVARLFLPEALLGEQARPAIPELGTLDAKHAATAELPAVMPEPTYGRHRPALPAPAEPAVAPADRETDRNAEIAFTTGTLSTAAVIEPVDPRGRYANGARTVPTAGSAAKLIPLGEAIDRGGVPPIPAAPAADTVSNGPTSPDDTSGVTGSAPQVQRTRNGLVKRSRKTRENSGATPGGAQPAPPSPPTAPHIDRTPDEVRSMLAGFRAGHQRGERGVPHGDTGASSRPGTNTQEDRR
ncbi:nitrate- and nitrite sensing domain-containing protein [Nocardia sp. NBC_01503]|uniref:sensor histidine kinase n=1 Tax=Nocardia sp. NBC_01503 TaxID=2975997 RepID=UPI002E7B38C6|nr:nitrate- and nitrite sensing domain-containing protein [Nocardia sp. NBC_01503]WTL33311.1 nitrate- and nitrite sensing domain-containing protein [Nocardia sp. NBC_01503]